MDGRLAWISIAPVKALALCALDAADLAPEGIVENRRFHLIDDSGRMVNGKRLGFLVRIRPAYDDAAGHLSLAFPGGSEVAGPVEARTPVTSIFFGRPRAGHLVAGPFSEALSDFAGARLRLVRPERPAAGLDRGRGGAISLVSTAALDGLDARRFRMLFGVEGVPAHAEDDWVGHRVQIGAAVVRPTGHTGRCLITSQSPDTGVADMDMLGRIRQTRPDDASEPLPFGVHGSVAQPGRVAVGDPVRIL